MGRVRILCGLKVGGKLRGECSWGVGVVGVQWGWMSGSGRGKRVEGRSVQVRSILGREWAG